MLSNKKILIIGSNGQIGRSFFSLKKKNKNLKLFFVCKKKKNYLRASILKKILENNNYNYVINCAAFTDVDSAEIYKNKALELNYKLVKNIISLIKNKKIFFIHFSTEFVFSGKKLNHYNENDKMAPLNYYGTSKSMADNLILSSKIPCVIFRISWLFSQWNNNFLKKILTLANNNSYLKVVNDQRGSPTYALELANNILEIIRLDKFRKINTPQIFNYRNKGIVTWYLFAKKILKVFKIKCNVYPISYKDYNSKVSRPKNSCLSINKFRKFFKIKISTWQNSISHCYNNKL